MSQKPLQAMDPSSETLEIVDEVKRALRIPESDDEGHVDPVSDYRVAQMLGVSRATVSKWRQGKGGMSDATALKASAITGADPVFYLLRVAMERTESVGAAGVLEGLVRKVQRTGRAVISSKKIASILLVCAGSLFAFHPATAEAVTASTGSNVSSMYIMSY